MSLVRVVVVAGVAGFATAHADPEPPDDDEEVHWRTALVETAIAIAIPTVYYWDTQSQQEVDWTLGWDWHSWKGKLTLDQVRFDTNPFVVNAVRHPLTGVIDYQIGRTNGFGVLGSTLLAYAAGAFWEYIVEFHEEPSINDLIMNGAGLSIGEPLYQLGQIWRGSVESAGDYARTALFSPIDVLHDLALGRRRWWRPRVWRRLELAAGMASRDTDTGRLQGELVVGADFEVVSHPGYLGPADRAGTTAPGSWNRIGGSLRLDGHEAGVAFRSRTSIAGYYQQQDGDGLFVGVGTAFTYRRDRLAIDWDRLAIAHLVGPQLELSRRTADFLARWELAAYADFAMIEAYALGPGSPRPPVAAAPYESTIQVRGYYDGAGVTATTRFRIDTPAWIFAIEGDAHRIWQLDGADRDPTRAPAASLTTVPVPTRPHGFADLRLYGHLFLELRVDEGFGVGVFADAVYRQSSWQTLDRRSTEGSLGLAAMVEL